MPSFVSPPAAALRTGRANIGVATYRHSQESLRAAPRPFGCSLAMADYPHEVIGGPPVTSAADHFIQCPACGSWLDCRNLGDLLAHEGWCSRHHHTDAGP